MINEEKFIQIMAAPSNLYNKIKDEGGYVYSPIPCMALDASGGIHFCDSVATGAINPIENGDIVVYVNGKYRTYGRYQTSSEHKRYEIEEKYSVKNVLHDWDFSHLGREQ